MTYKSETSYYRNQIIQYCKGNGLDLGSGGDPVTPTAIQVELQKQYTPDLGQGKHPVELRGDARDLYWFCNECMDYVFSSHLLEDFDNTEEILREWTRVIKPNGYLVILVPHRVRYPAYCTKTKQPPNLAHKHEFIEGELSKYIDKIGGFTVVRDSLANDNPDNYNIIFVARKNA